MFKKTITYTDYNGNEITEDFRFNLTKAEILEMEMVTPGGLSAMLDRIVKAKDAPAIIKEFKELILTSYGIVSDDGKRFIKNDEVKTAFSQTEAYSQLFMELAMNDHAAAEFVNNIIPVDIRPDDGSMDAAIKALNAVQ